MNNFFQYSKAIWHGNKITAEKILAEPSPAKCKKLGSTVIVRDQDSWNTQSLKIMETGCRAKFASDGSLSDFLKQTGNCTIVEARNDDFWGAGKDIKLLKADDNPSWDGTNHLGHILMRIRDSL